MLGAKPRFVDVRPDTATLDPDLLAAAIGPATRAVLPVHLYGGACDMEPILAVAVQARVAVVEDAAQAHGTCYQGRAAGTMGQAGCFSFYPSKNLGAYGDAGAVVTDDPEVAERCRMLRNYGQRRRYEHVTSGVNSRLDELQAAVLRAKLPHLDGWNERRRAIAALWDAALDGERVRPLRRGEGHVCHLYVVTCDDRAGLQAFLESRGIGTQIHYPTPVHLQPAFAHLGLGKGSYPVSERLAATVLSLPMFPYLTDAEAERIASVLRAYGRG
jgi:dTDP-4-amino-4,6-dideoxygalactose transaminase